MILESLGKTGKFCLLHQLTTLSHKKTLRARFLVFVSVGFVLLATACSGGNSSRVVPTTPTQEPEPPSTQTWRGLTVAPENRCSPYDADDYSYSQCSGKPQAGLDESEKMQGLSFPLRKNFFIGVEHGKEKRSSIPSHFTRPGFIGKVHAIQCRANLVIPVPSLDTRHFVLHEKKEGLWRLMR